MVALALRAGALRDLHLRHLGGQPLRVARRERHALRGARLRPDDPAPARGHARRRRVRAAVVEKLTNRYRDETPALIKRVLENEKKKSFGGASKYLKQSELANTVTNGFVTSVYNKRRCAYLSTLAPQKLIPPPDHI